MSKNCFIHGTQVGILVPSTACLCISCSIISLPYLLIFLSLSLSLSPTPCSQAPHALTLFLLQVETPGAAWRWSRRWRRWTERCRQRVSCHWWWQTRGVSRRQPPSRSPSATSTTTRWRRRRRPSQSSD